MNSASNRRCIQFRSVRIVHEAYAQTAVVAGDLTQLACRQRVISWGQDGATEPDQLIQHV